MKRFHELLVANRFKSISFLQCILMISLLIALAINKDQKYDVKILESVTLFFAIGFGAIVILPFLIIQKKILMFIRKEVVALPQIKHIYEALYIILFYLAFIGLITRYNQKLWMG